MSMSMERMVVAVSVATVWTNPQSSRSLDAPALQQPAAIRSWLENMALEDRLDLYSSNRIQTQAVYGTSVLAVEEQGDWVKVLIPQQGTRKEAGGYPGWIPRCQLVSESTELASSKRAEVITNTAWLYLTPAEPLIELSFLSSLPVLEAADPWIKVHIPGAEGIGYVKAEEVRLINGFLSPKPGSGHVGQFILDRAMQFLDLPYLWGGMSAFGYDCSGFAHSMHRYAGISIPRDASDQVHYGTSIEKDRLEPGDLLFFAYEEGKGAVHHVGIYAGGGRMIHSPETIKSIEVVELSSYKLIKEHCMSRRYWE
ncbi:C40 family peptidase [Paenibacillus sp. 32352]|uniref:C40 family peptidase n=1 Tax=Paenibacillus sp. 32352 TaxID=1969111 RepID=UPI00211899B3|nr:NlpC/P60 family protein [Paenibacillus sp. 32352]